jgi:hypothetical protein
MAVTITFACCFLHNYCEIFSERVPLSKNLDQRTDHFVGVRRGPLRMSSNGRAGKIVVEQMRAAMFEVWITRNSSL